MGGAGDKVRCAGAAGVRVRERVPKISNPLFICIIRSSVNIQTMWIMQWYLVMLFTCVMFTIRPMPPMSVAVSNASNMGVQTRSRKKPTMPAQ